MKTKLLLFLTCWHLYVLPALAQPTKSFFLGGGRYKLTAICEWLNKEQDLNISFNHNEKALQKEVEVAKGEYTFERFFNQYFRPQQLAYKSLGAQIIIYAIKATPAGIKDRDNHVTLNGYISDSASGERLQGTTVAILNKEMGTVSNNYGFYSLTIPEGINYVVVNVVGYEPIITTLDLQSDTAITFKLAPIASTLSTITVTATGAPNKKIPIQQSTQMSLVDMPIESIESMPKLLGETDVFRALQILPGVVASNEISSGLYIRGGSPDQNLILLDGVPVYNASHVFGLFSAFNSDALQSVQLYKGGFPARYGGRLSSVVDLRMKEGNKHAWHGEGAVGLLASRFTLEGPFRKGRSSIMMSSRATNLGPVIALVSKLTADKEFKNKTYIGFYDLNLKTNFYLSPKDHLYISSYLGNDKLRSEDTFLPSYNRGQNRYEFGLKWGNATAVARWNHQFNKKVFSNTTLHFSRYQYGLFTDEEGSKYDQNNTFRRYRSYQKNTSELKDVALKYDIDIFPNPDHTIRTGAAATRHQFVPGVFHSINEAGARKTEIALSDARIISYEIEAYAEDDVRFSSKLKANIGLHTTGYKVGSTFYTSLQPRLNARYLLTDQLSVKGSLVYMNQFIHLLTNTGIGLPTDLWVPVTERIPPQKSVQLTTGVAYTSATGIELSAEGYLKQMKSVLEYAEGATFTNTTVNWEQRVAIGEGKSYGMELFAQKKKGKTTGIASYTLSKADRTFATINEGETFPFRYDSRHEIKTAISHKLSARKELSFNWVLNSGHAVTIPLETYMDQNGERITVYTARNGFRMPTYHRADVSFRFDKQKRRWLRSWVISVYNVYGRKNPFILKLNSHEISNVTGLEKLSIIPFPMPFFTYQIKF